FYTLGSFRWEVLMLATVSFPIYTRALWNAVRGKETSWHVTGAKGRRSSPFNFIVPQVLFFVFLAFTSVVGGLKDATNGQLSLAMAWNTTNALILGAFMVTAVREHRETRRAGRASRARRPRQLTQPTGALA
ncbi:MAG: glycosyl transferase family 2, partial [Cellulomonadaceae bacterium]